MAIDSVNWKGCYEECGLLLPIDGAVIICLVLALVIYCVWVRRKASRSARYTQFRNQEEVLNVQKTENLVNDILIQDLDESQRKNEALRIQLEETEKEKKNVLSRLSEKMSAKLRDGNPRIADLSDENRPTNIKDQLSELYDNEYTDAMTHLEDEYKLTVDEQNFLRETSAVLLNILKCSFEVCTSTAIRQLAVIDQVLVLPNVDFPTASQTRAETERVTATLPKEYLKKIKDIRKSFMPEISELIKKIKTECSSGAFLNCFDAEPIKTYLKSCVEITWLIAVQDPPMYLKFDETNRDHLREFTNSGPEIDFMVWPSLYLVEGGTSMSKGIAQFKESGNDSMRL